MTPEPTMAPECGCIELEWDLLTHGVHYCYEGRRLDPEKIVRVLDVHHGESPPGPNPHEVGGDS